MKFATSRRTAPEGSAYAFNNARYSGFHYLVISAAPTALAFEETSVSHYAKVLRHYVLQRIALLGEFSHRIFTLQQQLKDAQTDGVSDRPETLSGICECLAVNQPTPRFVPSDFHGRNIIVISLHYDMSTY
jgi:hypothetical protein